MKQLAEIALPENQRVCRDQETRCQLIQMCFSRMVQEFSWSNLLGATSTTKKIKCESLNEYGHLGSCV